MKSREELIEQSRRQAAREGATYRGAAARRQRRPPSNKPRIALGQKQAVG